MPENRVSEKLTTKEQFETLLDDFDTFLFDCDGVIWTGPTLVPGVKEVLDMLRTKGQPVNLFVLPREYSMLNLLLSCMCFTGKHIVFVTNNAKKSRAMYKKAFDNFGIAASVDEIFGSAYATAIYLSEILKFPTDGSKRVYVLGEEGLEKELESVGITYCGGTVRREG